MEGVFHSPSSTTEFHFAQDSKRTSSDNNLPNLPLSDTRSIRSATASHMKSSHQSSDATPKLYSLTSISRAKSSLENNQTNLCINPPHHFNFLSGLKKWQNFSRKEEEDPFESTLQVADEEKEVLNVSGYCEEMRPSAGTQRNLTHRSKTPMSYRSKGSSTVRKDNPYPSPFISVQEGDDNMINNVIHGPENGGKESPKKIERYYSSSERYFQVKTGKIVERSMENRTSSGFKRASYSNRGSLMKMSKSRFGDSPRKSFHSTPKRLTRMDSLKDIKLTGSPNASSGAKLGISLVKETLEEVMEEKEQWRLRVEELKDAIKQEKVCLEKSQENVRYLTNHMGCLTRRSETLDRNTTGVQAQTYRLQEEVNQLQEEIRAYVEGLRNVVRQIEAEAQLVKYTKELNKSLKACVYEKTKQRDTYKTRAQSSKRSRNKSLEKYETAAKTQKTFATVLEDQFQRYAA